MTFDINKENRAIKPSFFLLLLAFSVHFCIFLFWFCEACMQIHGGQAGGPWWCEMFRSWFLSTACLKLRMQRLWCFNCFNDKSYNSSLLIQFPWRLWYFWEMTFATGKKTWRKWLGNDVEDIDVWTTSPGGAPAAAWRPSWGGSCAGRSADLRVGTDRAAACWGSGSWVERKVMWPCATRATLLVCVEKRGWNWKLVCCFGETPNIRMEEYLQPGGFFSQPCWITNRISSPAVPSKWWPRTTWTGKFRDAFLERCIF